MGPSASPAHSYIQKLSAFDPENPEEPQIEAEYFAGQERISGERP